MNWFCLRPGFSWIGAVFLALLFIPNGIFALSVPEGFSAQSAAEPASLVWFERVGQVMACVFVLSASTLRPGMQKNSWALLTAGILMLIYELWWIWYLNGPRTLERFYAPLAFLPVPGAILPVAALILLGVYAESFWIVLSGIILGIGHIGIHLLHACSAG